MGRWDRRSAATGEGTSKTTEPVYVSERHAALRAAPAELTPQQRSMCIWKKAGFSEVEIANHLACSTRRVTGQLSRAPAALRRAAQALRGPRSA